ncbi:MAG: DNA-processing protein DprA, partial [Candidatus Babeliales bacterium]
SAADDYAHEAIKAIVPSLVAHGWTIVSGGALGADTMAHEAALSSKGITVAVLGSGLLRPYPTKNKSLFQTIYTEGGAVVSPFPLLSDPLPGNFPARNRIISGLSRGCLVVQAAEKSGASITAHCALDQGRDVFAVPGLLNNPLSHGCHRLIQQGAKLVTSAQDILVEYGQDEVQEVSEQLSLVSPELESPQPLTPEGLLIQSCKKPKAIDELVQLTGKSLHEVQESLFNLQLEGVITQDFAGLWVCRG